MIEGVCPLDGKPWDKCETPLTHLMLGGDEECLATFGFRRSVFGSIQTPDIPAHRRQPEDMKWRPGDR